AKAARSRRRWDLIHTAAIARKSQRMSKSSRVAKRMRMPSSCLDIDKFHRDDLVGFAAVNDEADRFGRNEGAVRLTLGVQRVAAGGAGGQPALRSAAACEIEHMLVRKRGRDDLDQLARRRIELSAHGDPTALRPAAADDFELDDVVVLMHRCGSIKGSAGGPLRLFDVDMGRDHRSLLPSVCLIRLTGRY